MSTKEFLPYSTVRNNALKLGYKIFVEDKFIPDYMYVSFRGGAYMGNVLNEYLRFIWNAAIKGVCYVGVVAQSYTDVKNHGQLSVEGWTKKPEDIDPDSKILFIDDIFDSGLTINNLVGYLISKGLKRENIKVVVHDFKIKEYEKCDLKIFPDYYCRKHVIKRKEDELWIHYMSHELIGLTEEELEEHYYKEDPELRKVMSARL